MLIYILQELVKSAIKFEEIVAGSTSSLTHVEVKVDDLFAKVVYTSPLIMFVF